MFKINEALIFSLASYNIITRGIEYLKSGAVKRVFSDDDKVYAIVKGSRNYQVTLYFCDDDLEDYSCTCPAFMQYDGPCKHIMSVLLHLFYEQNNKHDVLGYDSDYETPDVPDRRRPQAPQPSVEQDILTGLFSKVTSPSRQMVDVDYEIGFLGYQGFAAELRMKLGVDRKYILRDVKEFLYFLSQGKPYQFGKRFTFNPTLHSFSDEDQKVFDVMREIYELQRSIYNHSYDDKIFIDGRYVRLTMPYLKKVAAALGNKPVHMLSPKDMMVSFETEKFFCPIVMEKTDNGVMVGPGESFSAIPLDGKFNIIQKGDDKIYLFDGNDPALDFIKGFFKKRDTILKFTGENEKKLLSLLPTLEKSKHIKLGSEIKKLYVKEPCKLKIHIDKYKKGISLDVRFNYGQYEINPLQDTNDYVYIQRNYEKEQLALKLIKDSGFLPVKNKYCIENEDKLYTFIKDVIPEFARMGDVFYSNEVKDLFSVQTPKVKSKVKSIGGNLLELDFDIKGFDPKTIGDILKAIREKKRYFKIKNGGFVSLEHENIRNLGDLLNDVHREDIKQNAVGISKYRMLGLLEKYRGGVLKNTQDAHPLEKIVRDVVNSKNKKIKIPESLGATLREYQITGYKWLKVLGDNGLGGVLADDMGLGKTLQAITYFLSLKQDGTMPKISLVVAPSTLIYNWESEIKKFAPELKTLVVAGDKLTRKALIKKIMDYEVIITSYPLMRNDVELYTPYNFELLILDEAQHIKNPDSQNAKSVKQINSKARFALTGTPIENTPTELWSIFDFIMPGYLFSYKRFHERYEKPIVNNQDKNALAELRNLIAPFVLRRTKKDVLKELPDKIETTLTVDLTPQQKKLYLAYLVKIKEEIREKIESEGFEKSKMHILSGLLRLRQICCHPKVFVENYRGTSGKMELLEELLDELLNGGHRILLFSQFTSMLALIIKMLDKKKIDYLYLDGATKVANRKKIVDGFNRGKSQVFLISLKAGGVGLNLTSADTVIHFDPWWNPAVEQQASDRAYRIGQKNNVQVIRLITKGTIEEKIDELQTKKKDIADSIITKGEVFLNSMSKEDILDLFNTV